MTIASEIYPVLCGSAFKNRGVQPMLDAVVDYLPSPLDVPATVAHDPRDEEKEIVRKPDATEPFAALAFKVAVHPFFGRLTYVRVYSGAIDSGAQIVNSTKGKKERIGKIFQMHANKENPVESVTAGHIYAVIGLKDTTTGDTLCDPNNPVVLESMTFPEPVIEVAHRAEDQGRPRRSSARHPEAGRGGPDVPHRAERRDRPDRHQGHGRAAPRHPRGSHEARVQRRGQRRQAAGGLPRDDQEDHREVRLHPQEADRWVGSVREGPDLARADGCHAGDELRVRQRRLGRPRAARVHPLGRRGHPGRDAGRRVAGFPTVGVKATLIDGAAHDVDSSEMAFKIAGSMAFKEAARKANPVLLEPLMAVEVRTPEEYMGDVIGDLNSRRGQIQSMEDATGVKVVRALVPLSEMFGYVGDLRSKTSGRAVYSMTFDSYAEVPKAVADEIVQKSKGE